MANNIIFTDGFDYYTTILDKWDAIALQNTSVSPTIVPGAGRGGAGALFFPVDAGAQNVSVVKNVGAQGTLYIGFALNWIPGSGTDEISLVRFMDGTTAQVILRLTPSGVLYFTRNGTSIGASTSISIPANSFHFLEVKVVISSTVGEASLRLDQTAILTQPGLNTSASGSSVLTSVQFGWGHPNIGPNGGSGYIDDVYFDTLGYNGDNRINGQLPTGNGTQNDFSNVVASFVASAAVVVGQTISDGTNLQRVVVAGTNGGSAPTWASTTGVNTTSGGATYTCLGAPSQYKYVNEPNPDGDSSYISSNTVGQISRFTFPAISASTIKSVILWPTARKDDGGLRTLQGSIKSGATVATTGTDVAVGGNYQQVLLISATDPATGVAWTAAGLNAAELGVKLTN